jgi:hypothetical protein
VCQSAVAIAGVPAAPLTGTSTSSLPIGTDAPPIPKSRYENTTGIFATGASGEPFHTRAKTR